ncbi:hypothetical protein [Azotobacter chroococcum]|nr:hypothetical protein [Azotobacter chroococcum]
MINSKKAAPRDPEGSPISLMQMQQPLECDKHGASIDKEMSAAGSACTS